MSKKIKYGDSNYGTHGKNIITRLYFTCSSHVDIIRNDYAKMITVIYISSWVRILLDIYVCTKQLSVPTVMKLLKFYVVQSSISGLFHK